MRTRISGSSAYRPVSAPSYSGSASAGLPSATSASARRRRFTTEPASSYAVRASGVTIRDITTEDPDLEDVFVAMTYGDANRPDPTKD